MASHIDQTPAPKRLASLLACAALLLGLAWAVPQAAWSANLGSGNSFNELTKEGATTPTQTTTTSTGTSSTNNSNSGSLLFVGGGVAIVLLGGIAFVIVRDARRVAPAADVRVADGASRGTSAARMQRRRARAKAARQQRKRNR